MPEARRRYRRKPFAVFENGRRIYAPTRGEDCYPATNTLYGRKSDQRTVGGLARMYMEHISGKSTRYRERQEGYLRCWILPRLSDAPVTRRRLATIQHRSR